jgi:hypothetical protein
MKWSGSGWDSPALGGSAAPLDGSIGMSAAYWTNANGMLVMAAASALRLSISADKVHFATLAEPVILYDDNDWKRPAPTDLYAYPSMIGEHGFNDIGPRFLLAYTYIPPGADFTQRYLVMHEARIELSSAPRRPQVRVALSRWKNEEGLTWATTGPPIFAGVSFTYDLSLGYVMTAPPPLPSVKLDECFSQRWAVFSPKRVTAPRKGANGVESPAMYFVPSSRGRWRSIAASRSVTCASRPAAPIATAPARAIACSASSFAEG